MSSMGSQDKPVLPSAQNLPQRPSLEGAVIDGKYQLIQRIGGGGYGDVYSAVNLFSRTTVVLKCMIESHIGRVNLMENMRQEALITGQLRHPNIVSTMDGGVVDGRVYLVMEKLFGCNAAQLLTRRGPLPLRCALVIVADAAQGLMAAHAIGITHRDIKPDNLFVCVDGRTKILDFGNAKTDLIQRAPTGEGTMVGTLLYMAPEQVEGHPVDGRTDIFALGMTLVELLTGEHPFANRTGGCPPDRVLCDRISKWDPERAVETKKKLPASIWRIVKTATARDPRDRYDTAEAFRDELVEQLDRAGVDYRPFERLDDIEDFSLPVRQPVRKQEARGPALTPVTIPAAPGIPLLEAAGWDPSNALTPVLRRPTEPNDGVELSASETESRSWSSLVERAKTFRRRRPYLLSYLIPAAIAGIPVLVAVAALRAPQETFYSAHAQQQPPATRSPLVGPSSSSAAVDSAAMAAMQAPKTTTQLQPQPATTAAQAPLAPAPVQAPTGASGSSLRKTAPAHPARRMNSSAAHELHLDDSDLGAAKF